MITRMVVLSMIGLVAVSCGGKKKSKKSVISRPAAVCQAELTKLTDEAAKVLDKNGPHAKEYLESDGTLSPSGSDKMKETLDKMVKIRKPSDACRTKEDDKSLIYNQAYVDGLKAKLQN